MYLSKGITTNLCDQISQLFRFQKVYNLEIYLTVPLLHDRVTKSTLNFIMYKVRHKLQSLEVRKLSIKGRVTLAHLVLLAIPNYFTQSMLISKGVCAETERIVRQFIWGCSSGHPKLALVGQDSICQPKSRGGLGFQHFQDQNSSVLMKVGFNLITIEKVLWVLVLRTKYG